MRGAQGLIHRATINVQDRYCRLRYRRLWAELNTPYRPNGALLKGAD